MKKTAAFLLSFLLASTAIAKNYTVKSPSGALEMTVSSESRLTWSLTVQGEQVLADNPIALKLSDGRVLGQLPKVRKATMTSHVESFDAPFYRQAHLETAFNCLVLTFKDGWSLEVRAYDDGVAYRFSTRFPGNLEILDETVSFSFTQPYNKLVPYVSPRADIYETSFESPYTLRVNEIHSQFSFMPVYIDLGGNGHLLLMESDLEDYPGIFLQDTDRGFRAVFPPVPTAYKKSGRAVDRPTSYGTTIARVNGTRTFPWRVISYAENMKDLAVNDMVYALAAPSRIEDTSWIQPGQSTWDWWNGIRRHGVDFKAGINTETYLYDINFAARFGIAYTLIDEGWYRNLDMMTPIEAVDIPRLCKEAREKGVKLMLWCTSGVLDKDLETICTHYEELGVAGFKVDFFDAQDQIVVRQLYRFAETAAKHHLLLDFHGIFKPTGLSRTWPNVLNYEGVYGLEQLKWTDRNAADMPGYDVTFPFIRMSCGPVDYTPGALRNATQNDFRAINHRPMSQGTRAHQVATYIVFDAPYAMLCDSPSDYLKEEQTTRFITSVPTVFDKTRILSGVIGKHIVTLREKDGRFYVGGLASWDGANFKIDFSFLPAGQWKVRLFRDGVNCTRSAEDYVLETLSVSNQDRLNITMAPGGGFAMIIE